MYPAVHFIYFISAAVILLVSLALIFQVSLLYNKTGRASVLYNFILVFLRVQRLKVAILPLDVPCSGPVTHSGEIFNSGKSHGKNPDRLKVLYVGNYSSVLAVCVTGLFY